MRQKGKIILGAPKRWDDRLVLAAVELPPHRFGALTNNSKKDKIMNEHAIALQALMQKDALTPKEVKEGVIACFFTVNRNFIKRRLGDVPAKEVDATLNELITDVFNEHQIDPENPSLPLLKKAELVLEEQAGFEAEPDLLVMHKEVIQTLFSRARK